MKDTLTVVPLSLKEGNAFVTAYHRHHKPTQGHKFSIGVTFGGTLVGVAIAGRPVARGYDFHKVLEVTRLATDGTPNACSILYAHCARIAQAMGYERIQSYILEDEPGTSLKASGWTFDGMTAGGDWNNSKANKGTRRVDQPQGRKQRWIRHLK